tara:strand:- start:311 stop:1309 length:999 start_codon:yes stop_codon:yes gene_type:complete
MTVLLTGGLGYIGSNVCLVLERAGIQTVIVDDLSNSYLTVKAHLDDLVNRNISYYQGDINNRDLLTTIFSENKINCVMHFAGLKSAPDSINDPMQYYSVNVKGALNVLSVSLDYGVKNFIFSSSATVYGVPDFLPIKESHPLVPCNPYASSKLMFEKCLSDISISDSSFKSISLRYFNPMGSDDSYRLRENPKAGNKNLAPSIISAAMGTVEQLNIYGSDYDTPDGTAIRDYIHVVDLAEGHLKAYQALEKIEGSEEINLGTGSGYSVLEAVTSFEAIIGRRVPVKYKSRRAGDVPVCFADVAKASDLLQWKARLGLDEMCGSAWNAAKLAG